MRNGTLPEELKLVEVTPPFKKAYLFDKKSPREHKFTATCFKSLWENCF